MLLSVKYVRVMIVQTLWEDAVGLECQLQVSTRIITFEFEQLESVVDRLIFLSSRRPIYI